MSYNTRNPIGSTDPRDLSDNAKCFDSFANGPATTYKDRLGVNRKSIPGMIAEFDSDQSQRDSNFQSAQDERTDQFDRFMESSAYALIGDYGPGLVIERHSQYVMKDGQPYRLSSFVAAPYTTTGDWGAESDAFVLLGDETLRQDLINPFDPNKGAGALGFLGGSVYAALMAKRCMPVEVLSTKYNLPISDVGAIINAAWDDGIGVYVWKPFYTSGTDLLVRTDCVLVGPGCGLVTIKAVDGYDGNMIDTLNFDGLKAAQSVSVNDPINPVPKRFILSGFALDGNADKFGGVVSDSNGFGIRLYGGGYSVIDLKLSRIAGVGFYSALAPSGTYYNSDADEPKPFDPHDEYGGVGIRGLYIHDTGEEGFVFVGPADIQVRDVYVGWPAGSRRNEYVPGKRSKLYPARTVDGAVVLRSCEVGYIHSFDNRFGYAIYVDREGEGRPSVRFNAEYIMGENSFGNIYIGSSVRYQIGMMDSHNNTGGDGTRPHVTIAAAFGGVCENVKIKREAGYLSEHASDAAVVTGVKQKLKFHIETTAGQTAGRGVVCAAPLSDIEVVGTAMQGTTILGSASCVAEVTSAFTASTLKVHAQLCDVGINFVSLPSSGDYSSTFDLVSDRCTTPVIGLSSMSRRQARMFNITHVPVGGGTTQRSESVSINNINLTSTLVQTLVVAHGLVGTPPAINCTVNLVPNAGSTMGDIAQRYVESTDANNITVKIRFSTAGTGTATLAVDARI
ncbi:hypothetical protein WHX55_10975 [Pseudomonas fluorescens]|uniref:hypothetical protein n=1 Tax=Pseudomonas fluorescens TaxID=294 RepID=UPI0032492AC8